MQFKKLVSTAVLSLALFAPSSCVPPDVQAACTDYHDPAGKLYQDYVYPNGDHWVTFDGWDADVPNTRAILVYINGKHYTTVINAYINTRVYAHTGMIQFYVWDDDSCGNMVRGTYRPKLVGQLWIQ